MSFLLAFLMISPGYGWDLPSSYQSSVVPFKGEMLQVSAKLIEGNGHEAR